MTSLTNTPPILLSATPTVIAGGMSIDLVFNTAMAAGSGTIYITDGAVQTVIDRATGQPTMRVVGATDTHTISASSISVDGTHVKLNVSGLLPDHAYSIVMGNGVLVSSAHVAFGGVRATSQIRFTTDPAPDGDAPTLVSHEIDGSLLKAGGSLQVTLVFSEPVSGLTAEALNAPNAAVSALAPVGDGHAWVATLVPAGAAEQPANVLTIDMSKVRDAAGNAGKGVGNVASYSVDTKGPAASIALDGTELTGGHDIVATVSFSEAVKGLDAAALQAGHASITNISGSEDGKTWKLTLHGNGSAAGEVLSLDLGKVADLAGNLGSGTVASNAYTVDTQGPSGVAIALDGSLLKTGATVGVTFTFSEAVRELPASAITAPHAVVEGLTSSDGGRTWAGTLKALDPNTSSGNTLSVDLTKLQDLKGNAGSGSVLSSATYAIDTVAPMVADIQLNGSAVSSNEGVEVVMRFSEKVSLGADAIQAPNATLLGLSTSDGGLTWKTILRPGAGQVEVSGNKLTIDMSKVIDAAGNAGSGFANAAQTYDVDTVGPSATISLDGSELLHGGGIAMKIVLSQKVTDIAAILDVPSATLLDSEGLSTLHTEDGGLTWTATLSTALSLVDAVNAVTLDLRGIHDAHGNAGSLVTSANYVVDGTVQAYVEHDIGINDWHSPDRNDHISSEASQWFSGRLSGELAAGQKLMLSIDGGAEFEASMDGSSWYDGQDSMHFEDGAHTISARVVDGTHQSASFTQSFTIDTAAPAMLSSPAGASGGAGDDLVFTFDEAMYLVPSEGAHFYFTDAEGHTGGVYLDDSNFSADRRTLTVSASDHHFEPGKDYTIELSSDVTDLAGNAIRNLQPMHFRTSGVDTLAPTAMSAASLTSSGIYGIGKEIQIAVEFSEAVQKAGSGTPTLRLTNNGLATWDHASADGRTVYFKYIVGANGEDDTHGSDSLALVDSEDLAGHVSDLAGNLLDAAHISFSGLDIPYVDGYGHHDSGGRIQIDAHAGPAPSAPALAADSDTGATGDNLTSLHTPGLSGNGAASFARVKLFDENGTLLAQTTAKADNTWTFAAGDWLDGKSLADGTHQLTVKQVDGANNESPASAALTLKVDSTIAPATVTLGEDSDSGSSHSDLLTNETQPVFSGTGEVGALIRVWDGSTIVGETRIDNGGIYEVRSLHSLAQGEHTLTVEQTDLAGNFSDRATSTPVNFRIDFTPPEAPSKPVLDAASDTGVSDSDGITRDNTPTIKGSAAEAGGTIQIYEDDMLLGSAEVKADKSWSFTVGTQDGYPAALADGTHDLTARHVDAAGNRSEYSAALHLTIDTAAPTVALQDSGVDSGTHKGWISLEFNEQIVFGAGGQIDVIDTITHLKHSEHVWNAMTNWRIVNGEMGTRNTLELNLGTLNQIYKLHVNVDASTIEDLAGNIVIVGSNQDFTLGPIPS
ncbi:hypothetical protein SRABI118_00539 [Massilia sp. Bi118]|uniref:Ig-like domain-containing protein n=1 Tax=Massilia sp. Bi118 TaxID=2822346 RepID=UPI001DB89C32|nr:Ig-like domain-containing protein [Massilia sp. Bi118]CAH0152001.1 hypothetical protein SRABI118_00539 [Massilia sp. Bi118]